MISFRHSLRAILLFSALSCEAAITAYFTEESNGVRLSFHGVLSVDPSTVEETATTSIGPAYAVSDSTVYLTGPSSIIDGLAGTPFSSGLDNRSITIAGPREPNISFGFHGSSLIFSTQSITGGSIGAVSEITVDYQTSNYLFQNLTLEDFGADQIPDGFVLWSAAITQDTIVFSSGVPVPEPSSAALILVAIFGASSLRCRNPNDGEP